MDNQVKQSTNELPKKSRYKFRHFHVHDTISVIEKSFLEAWFFVINYCGVLIVVRGGECVFVSSNAANSFMHAAVCQINYSPIPFTPFTPAARQESESTAHKINVLIIIIITKTV